MPRHVVRTLDRVPVTRIIFRSDSLKVIRQIQHNIRIGVLLNHQRRRGVLDENRQQSSLNASRGHPLRNLASKRIESLAASSDFQAVREVRHLLDSDALGEVPRLIHVAAAFHRDVIRQQLERQNLENRQQ